ncbi:hypothetical protein D918_03554 [Trichuris suis]|nr:hypothetical protein D918_03554 [Trichuris suis]
MVCCSLVRECQSRQFGWRTIQRLFPLVNRSAFMKVHGMVWASTTNEPVSYVVSEDLQPNTPRSEPVISTEDYKWVERLLPKALIPDVPLHRQFPTPSGWIPPKDRCAHCRYYVRRNRFHLFPVYSEIRRDTLNPETLEFSYVEIAILKKVEGDVFACEKDLTDFLEKRLGHPVATHVNEPQGKIRQWGKSHLSWSFSLANEMWHEWPLLAVLKDFNDFCHVWTGFNVFCLFCLASVYACIGRDEALPFFLSSSVRRVAAASVNRSEFQVIDGPAVFLRDDDKFLHDPWTIKEELRLLETVEAFNLGDWQDVQRCINPKRTAEEISSHYEDCYLNGRLGKEVSNGLTYAQLTDHTSTSSCPTEVTRTDGNGYCNKYNSHDLRLLAYMPHRDDFEKEFMNDAESLISNLLFISDGRQIEHEAQLCLISMYISRLNERRKCKKLIGEYDLISQFLKEQRPCGIHNYWKYSPADVRRMKEERSDKMCVLLECLFRELKEGFRRFCQFIPASELEALISNLMKERAVKSRIEELQEYCKNGVTSLKGKREFDLNLTPRRRRKNRRLRFSRGQKRNVKSWLQMRHRQKRYFDPCNLFDWSFIVAVPLSKTVHSPYVSGG